MGHLEGRLKPEWRGLTLLEHRQQDAEHATVACVARYRLGGMAMKMVPTSHYRRPDGRWYYLDGEACEGG